MEISYHTITFVLSFLLALILGAVLLPLFRRWKVGQTIRTDGPVTHLVKTGTPVMGGLIFYVPVLLFGILYSRRFEPMFALFIPFFGFGLIGFADDLIKVIKKNKDGLRFWQKTVLQLAVAIGFVVYAVNVHYLSTDVILPFTRYQAYLTVPGWLYYPLIVLLFYFVVNAVNLTDGVDGLCALVTWTILLFYVLVARVFPAYEYMVLFGAALTGGLIAFLIFNLHPAKWFMGDTGSMALGGAVTALAVLMQVPWMIIPIGLVYVIEALSVIIQVTSFKFTGKRVFKMTPIHHHFELMGWGEYKIVFSFSLATALFCLIAWFSIFY